MSTLFKNARIIDAAHPGSSQLQDVYVADGIIRAVGSSLDVRAEEVIDVDGKVLMPGLIDCHVHVVASMVNLGLNAKLPNAFALFRAAPILRDMLNRGFTSVRDAGGADFALAQCIAEGLISGPRLFTSGKALSQTGGHGDFRARMDYSSPDSCPCAQYGSIGRIVDGVDELRKAIRQEIRQGATQIKIMASGGVSSPTDPIGNLQFSDDEIKAAVEEARAHQTYVMAHAYTAQAIRRAVAHGVRTIEHGNLIDDETAAFMASVGAYVVPTLITYEAMRDEGAAQGYPIESQKKNVTVLGRGLDSLRIYKKHGVKMAYGSDLLGSMHQRQSEEMQIRAQVYTPYEVILQATSVAAEVLNMQDQLGIIAEGAIADVLVVDGDPTNDLSILGNQGANIPLIMKDGVFVKRNGKSVGT
ncbi:amidohydrolase family protein [Paraburkholderia sp. MM5482-R1]|uniref:metal-dependent hydrolase family protein n=1 Tax=unclassified Paraburkholderia TaxID=2615204 RepID=UPI003D2135A0